MISQNELIDMLDLTDIIFLIVNIISAIVIASLFRYVWRPKFSHISDKKVEETIKMLFEHIERIDGYKSSIYDKLNGIIIAIIPNSIQLSEIEYNEIIRLQKLIYHEIELMYNMQIYRTYLTNEQYVFAIRYAYSASQFITHIDNCARAITIDQKTLQYHVYYASKIITLFKKIIPYEFEQNWKNKFKDINDFNPHIEPKIELGDSVKSHHNINNHILNNYFTKLPIDN